MAAGLAMKQTRPAIAKQGVAPGSRHRQMFGRQLRWLAHPVAKIPHGYQLAVADPSGKGRLDIFALSSEESIVEWYGNPARLPSAGQSWAAHSVTTATVKNISLAPLMRMGYPLRGMALASGFSLENSSEGGDVWWAEPGADPDAEWNLRGVARIPTAHRLRWADLDGDGKLELVIVPLLGAGAVPPDYAVGAPITWLETPETMLRGHVSAGETVPGLWAAHLVDKSLHVVHGVLVMDWDGDGRDELLTASFEGVHLFHSSGKGDELEWTKTRLASGDEVFRPRPAPPGTGPRRGSSEIGVGQLAGRRFLATIEPWHGEQVVVYFDTKPGELWERRVIDASFKDGHALAIADLNGDGSDEIMAGYRGQGTSLHAYYATDATGKNWERQTLDTGMAASSVAVADINGDGRPDVAAIGASTGNVVCYENLGS
jgi:aldos-2-ulose dehydratase/isomerase family protein/VCBS repeat protein